MKKLVSYIFPIYNETGNIELLHDTMQVLLAKHQDYRYELIFVNDGSRDDSLDKLLSLQNKDERISVINFSRNFGHQLAVTAGLDFASGDAVIIMDADMQDPPSVSMDLLKKWEEGFEVVYAQRRTRQDTLFKRASANLFYRVLRKLANIDIPRNTGDFRLLDRKVVLELRKFQERSRFLRGLVSYVGFKQTGVLFDRDRRHAGTTGYPLRKMIKFALDGILGFSSAPLRLISQFGFLISFLSFMGIIYVLVQKVVDPATTVPGWAFTMIAMLLMGGIQLIMLGVLGMYIGRVYTETQQRPLYIVSSVFSSRPNQAGASLQRPLN